MALSIKHPEADAAVAVLLNEPDAERYRIAIEEDPVRLMSAASVLDTSMVVEARAGEAAGRELDLMLHKVRVQFVAVDAGQVEIARQAFRTYGRGRHPAKLNFGDCFAYALSKSSGEPLLFKGQDYSLTDIEACVM